MKKLLAVLFIIAAFPALLCAKKADGYEIADNITAGKDVLVLNGAGVRKKFFVGKHIYLSGLYLKAKSSDAEKIIAADESMAVRIDIVSSLVTPKNFVESTMEGFKESMGGDITPLKKEIDMFINVFRGGIKKGDVYDVVYSGGELKVYKNKSVEPSVSIKGMPIKKAVFGIWLKDRSENYLMELKRAMLGL